MVKARDVASLPFGDLSPNGTEATSFLMAQPPAKVSEAPSVPAVIGECNGTETSKATPLTRQRHKHRIQWKEEAALTMNGPDGCAHCATPLHCAQG